MATKTFQPDVGAEAYDFPIETPTGMRLAHAHDVLDLQVR